MYIVLTPNSEPLWVQSTEPIDTDNYTTIPIDENLIKPKLVNNKWIENATAEELLIIEKEKIDSYIHKIYEKTEKLLKSALERALGKSNQGLTLIQLQNLQEIYDLKKNDAEKILLNLPINEISLNLLNYEIERDFTGDKLNQLIITLNDPEKANAGIDINLTPIKKYASLILFKHKSGNNMFATFKALAESFRSKLITNLDYKEFAIIDTRIELVNTINSETTITEILALNTQFNAL